GLKRSRLMSDPWQPSQVRVGFGNQISQRTAREIGQHDAISAVATRRRKTGRAIEVHGRKPVAGNPEDPTPPMSDRHVAERREEFDERTTERVVDLGWVLERRIDTGAHPIWSASTAEHNPIVRGALRIDEKAP